MMGGRARHHGDALALQRVAHDRGGIGVLARQQPGRRLQQVDAGSEALERLGQLATNGPLPMIASRRGCAASSKIDSLVSTPGPWRPSMSGIAGRAPGGDHRPRERSRVPLTSTR